MAVTAVEREPATAEVRPPPAAPPRSPRLGQCLQDTAALHRHLCPRQVLGVRMGLHAGELLGLELPRTDKRLFVFIESDGCFADAISVATGCWLGHRTLRLVDEGKIAATFVDTETGTALRVWPHPQVRVRARELAPEARSRWHAQLEGYQLMTASELLCSASVTLTVSVTTIRSRPGRRENCARCGEEIINEREVLVGDVLSCRSCSGARYFAAIGVAKERPFA